MGDVSPSLKPPGQEAPRRFPLYVPNLVMFQIFHNTLNGQAIRSNTRHIIFHMLTCCAKQKGGLFIVFKRFVAWETD